MSSIASITPPASIDPNLWGPSFWSCMHWAASGYPETPSAMEKLACQRFFTGMAGMIPCPSCKDHFTSLLHNHPIDNVIQNGATLRQWVLMLHNEVNRLIGSGEQWTLAQLNQRFPAASSSLTGSLEQRKSFLQKPQAQLQVQSNPQIQQQSQPQAQTLKRLPGTRVVVSSRRDKQVTAMGRIQGPRMAVPVPVKRTLVSRGVRSLRHASTIVQRGPGGVNIVSNPNPKKKKGCGCGAK